MACALSIEKENRGTKNLPLAPSQNHRLVFNQIIMPRVQQETRYTHATNLVV